MSFEDLVGVKVDPVTLSHSPSPKGSSTSVLPRNDLCPQSLRVSVWWGTGDGSRSDLSPPLPGSPQGPNEFRVPKSLFHRTLGPKVRGSSPMEGKTVSHRDSVRITHLQGRLPGRRDSSPPTDLRRVVYRG